MMVGLIGIADLLLSLSNKIPIIDSITINMSSWFHLDSFSQLSLFSKSKKGKKNHLLFFKVSKESQGYETHDGFT